MNARSTQTSLSIQAALTALFGLTAATTSHAWLVMQLAVAAAAVALALGLRRMAPATARGTVLGFEALAVAVGVLGLMDHRYIPGTIIAIGVLIRTANAPAAAPAAPAAVTAPLPRPSAPNPLFAQQTTPAYGATAQPSAPYGLTAQGTPIPPPPSWRPGEGG